MEAILLGRHVVWSMLTLDKCKWYWTPFVRNKDLLKVVSTLNFFVLTLHSKVVYCWNVVYSNLYIRKTLMTSSITTLLTKIQPNSKILLKTLFSFPCHCFLHNLLKKTWCSILWVKDCHFSKCPFWRIGIMLMNCWLCFKVLIELSKKLQKTPMFTKKRHSEKGITERFL